MQGSTRSLLYLYDSYQKWYVMCIQPNPRENEASEAGQQWQEQAIAALKFSHHWFGNNCALFSLFVS